MYKNILVPLDGSQLAECVLPHVETIIKGCGVERVTFVRVVEPVQILVNTGEESFYDGILWQQMESQSKAAAVNYIDQLVNRVKHDGVTIQKEVLTDGKAGDMIADYASRNDFSLIIIATHGRSGVSRWVWGSVADKILRSACIPVLMIKAPGCVPGF